MHATLLGAELVALEAADVGGGQPAGQIEVLAERAGDARPPRLGGDVGHRVERDVDADGAVLLPGDIAEAAHELLVPRRREPDRLGPLRERAGRPARRRVLVEGVPRIGRDRHRDAEPRRFRQLLHAVVPLGRPAGIRRRIDVEMVEVALGDEPRRAVAAEDGRAVQQLSVAADEDRRVEHQTGLLLERHARQEVVDALLDRPPRILVRIELPVAVEVAHAPTVDLERDRIRCRRHLASDHMIRADAADASSDLDDADGQPATLTTLR